MIKPVIRKHAYGWSCASSRHDRATMYVSGTPRDAYIYWLKRFRPRSFESKIEHIRLLKRVGVL